MPTCTLVDLIKALDNNNDAKWASISYPCGFKLHIGSRNGISNSICIRPRPASNSKQCKIYCMRRKSDYSSHVAGPTSVLATRRVVVVGVVAVGGGGGARSVLYNYSLASGGLHSVKLAQSRL